MISIANLIDSAKVSGRIETDYRLAKIIGINQSALGNYRAGRSLPDERVLAQLCALSGDDVAVFAALIQAERARTPQGKTLWETIAKRLMDGAAPAILSVCFAITLVAVYADTARASGVVALQKVEAISLYIVSITILTTDGTLLVRLRRFTRLLPGFSWFWHLSP